MPVNTRHSALRTPYSALRGFTLIELMVVIAIILVLLGTVIAVGHKLVGGGKERETLALLQKLDMAKKEWENQKPLGKMREVISRYGNFPPDELDGFKKRDTGTPGIPGSASGAGYISPRGTELCVGTSSASDNDIKDIEFGDIKAFALAVRLYSDTGSAILDDVASKYRRGAKTDTTGNVAEFLERSQPVNNKFDPGGDQPLDSFVDAWGTPIAYFSVRCDGCNPRNVKPTDAAAWDQGPPNGPTVADRLRTSLCLLELNNYTAFFVSYGADGPEQFSKDFFDPAANVFDAKDLTYDYGMDDAQRSEVKFKIDNRFNADNLYSQEGLKERVASHQ